MSGTFFFSVEEGYGNTCDPSSEQVSIPALDVGECFSIGFDGVGVGFEAQCAQADAQPALVAEAAAAAATATV